MFSEYCDVPFEVEAAEVVDSDGTSNFYPTLSNRTETVQRTKINKLIGKTLRKWIQPFSYLRFYFMFEL